MTHGSLFSGIGGPDLAAEWMGWENIFHCEINPFGKQVLKHYWPNSISYDNIKTTDFTIHRGHIDVLTGGFPCQPYSQAGKRLGKEDDRHLWPEMLRAIREIKPRWVVGENVSGLITWSGGLVFDEVQADLEAEGYEVQAYVLPAVSVNAPHRRDRVWFVAYCGAGIEGNEIGGRNEQTAFDGIAGYVSAGTTPNTVMHGHNGIKPAQGQQYNGWREAWSEFTPPIDYGATPHTNSRERAERMPGWQQSDSQETGSGMDDRPSRFSNVRNAPDTCNTRLQRMQFGQAPEQRGIRPCKSHEPTSKLHQIPDWRNFPTQSPVRRRNDGISPGLVGITVPKHRNESIKAYGNAIVPQVIYQIFKSIAEYESHP
jgi:DNA (cytosine-5)-methyltransferase 1